MLPLRPCSRVLAGVRKRVKAMIRSSSVMRLGGPKWSFLRS